MLAEPMQCQIMMPTSSVVSRDVSPHSPIPIGITAEVWG